MILHHHPLNNTHHSAGTMLGRPGHQPEASLFKRRKKKHLKHGSRQTNHVITDLNLCIEPTVFKHGDYVMYILYDIALYVSYCL